MSPTKEEVAGAVEVLEGLARDRDDLAERLMADPGTFHQQAAIPLKLEARAIRTLLQAYASETAAREKLVALARDSLAILNIADEYGLYEPGSLGDADVKDTRDNIRAVLAEVTGDDRSDYEIACGAPNRTASDIYGRLKGEPTDTGVK